MAPGSTESRGDDLDQSRVCRNSKKFTRRWNSLTNVIIFHLFIFFHSLPTLLSTLSRFAVNKLRNSWNCWDSNRRCFLHWQSPWPRRLRTLQTSWNSDLSRWHASLGRQWIQWILFMFMFMLHQMSSSASLAVHQLVQTVQQLVQAKDQYLCINIQIFLCMVTYIYMYTYTDTCIDGRW